METTQKTKANNSINTLHPYRVDKDLWVYDDEDLGVYSEAFVLGSSEVINHLVGMDCNKFTMHISSKTIPEYDAHLIKIHGREEGWYQLEGSNMEHWLCGQVLAYFSEYPEEIFVKITSKNQ